MEVEKRSAPRSAMRWSRGSSRWPSARLDQEYLGRVPRNRAEPVPALTWARAQVPSSQEARVRYLPSRGFRRCRPRRLRAPLLGDSHALVGESDRLLGEIHAALGDPRAGTELQRAVKILGTAYGATRAPARRAQLSLATFQARDGNAAALARLGELGNLPAGDFELRKVAWLARAEAAGLRCHGRQRPAALAALRALDGELRKALPEGGSVARRVRAIAAGCL